MAVATGSQTIVNIQPTCSQRRALVAFSTRSKTR
jgi:hypothetical protein